MAYVLSLRLPENPLEKLLNFFHELDERKLAYRIEHNRTGYLMVCVAMPGERWEVELDGQSQVEIEVFGKAGKNAGMEEEEAIARPFNKFG